MLGLVVLFAATLIPINEINGSPSPNLDEYFKALESNENQASDSQSDSSSSSDISDTSESDNNDEGALRSAKLVRFLQQARDKQSQRKGTENKRLSKLYTHLKNLNDAGRSKYLAKYRALDNNRNRLDVFVEYLLSQKNKKTYTKDKTARLKDRDDYLLPLNNKKQQKEDKLTKLTDPDDDVEDGNLQDYSRIYVILNPEALKSSQNKKDISALVSRLMSKSSSVSQSRISPKQLQYKGFPVRIDYAQRRSRRDSLEGGRDSTEDHYRPKRPRYNKRYGGGSAGGRTPIPYIRHHGDIYERDY